MKKVLMMIGASERHRPFIKRARELGLHVVGIDRDEEAPGREYCNVFAPISIKDKDRALRFAEEHRIDGCVSIPDEGVPTCAHINSMLGLKGITSDTYNRMTDKLVAKKHYIDNGVKTPRLGLAMVGFPCIIKPITSTGSSGVLRFDHYAQLEHFLGTMRGCPLDFIIEEYIDGWLFSIDLIMQDGEVTYGMLHERYLQYVSKGCFVDNVIISPSILDSLLESLFPVCRKALLSVGFEDGPANLQFILSKKEGSSYLIEINPRISGPYGIECHTMATGFEWVDDIINVALGNDVKRFGAIHDIKPNALITIGSFSSGTLDYLLYPEDPVMFDGLWEWKRKGDTIQRFQRAKDSIAHVFIMEDTFEEVCIRAFGILHNTVVVLK